MSVDEKASDAVHKEIHLDQDLAAIANREEHDTSKWQAIKKQPWAFVWCLYAVWTVLLVSFENQASGSILSIPEFRKDFGSFYNGDYVLDSKWQSAFNGAPVASQVVGALFGGQVADWIGRRNAIMAALVISFGAVTMEFVATTNELFFGGKFLNGFAVGTIQACAGTYIGEIVPLALRGLMTCAIALAYTVGPLPWLSSSTALDRTPIDGLIVPSSAPSMASLLWRRSSSGSCPSHPGNPFFPPSV